MILESERRRRETAKVYNSYRAARSQYSIEDIPMPDMLNEGMESYMYLECVVHIGHNARTLLAFTKKKKKKLAKPLCKTCTWVAIDPCTVQ